MKFISYNNTSKITQETILEALKNNDLVITNISDKQGKSPSVILEGQLDGIPVIGKAFGYSTNKCELSNDIIGLFYEQEIYEKVVPLLLKLSPNFIELVGVAEIPVEQIPEVYQTFNRYTSCETREMSMFFIKKIFGKTLTNYFGNNDINLQSIMAQLMFSLIAMQIVKVVHYDLHPGNILVEELQTPIDLEYKLTPDLTFTIPNVTYKIYIFDWDLSYSQDLGPNYKIVNFYPNFGIRNELNPIFDIFTILCYLYSEFGIASFHKFIHDITGKNLLDFRTLMGKTSYMSYKCRLPSIFQQDHKLTQWRNKQSDKNKYVFPDDKEYLKYTPGVGAYYENGVDNFIKILENPYFEGVYI